MTLSKPIKHTYHLAVGFMILLLYCTPLAMRYVAFGEDYLEAATGFVAFVVLLLRAKYLVQSFVRLSLIDVLLVACVFYVFFNLHHPINAKLCIELMALCGVWIVLRQEKDGVSCSLVVWGIIVVAIIQAIIALLQYLDVVSSSHVNFAVTGTFGNPGPLGCFLAMGIATLWPYLFGKYNVSMGIRIGLVVCAILLLLALIVTDSRAAWISVGVVVCLYHSRRYMRGKNMWLMIVAFSVLIIFALLGLYAYRPASVEARLRIWHVCMKIIVESPLVGHGTGSFASTYMPMQTATLATSTEEVQRQADDVTVAFNDLLGILCEQGIIGTLLIGGFVLIVLRNLWRNYKTDKSKVSIFPIVAFIVFSQFSYPLSVWSLCAPCFAMIAVNLSDERCVVTMHKCSYAIIGLSLLACAVFCLFAVLTFRATRILGSYCNLEWTPSATKEDVWMQTLVWHSPMLMETYADAQMMVGDKKLAIETWHRLLLYTNKTFIHIRLGDAYASLGSFKAADSCYITACTMRPGLLEPLYARFTLWKKYDCQRALHMARDVARFRPKIENQNVRAMKADAVSYIRSR